MAKRYFRATDLPSDDLREMVHEMLEFSDEDDIFSEPSSDEGEIGTVSDVPGTSATVRDAPVNELFASESSSESDGEGGDNSEAEENNIGDLT